jgi:4-hydroxy-3-methylbut-2-enyl diphosphate reductase
MKISIDKAAGFCPGVQRAIKKAEKELHKSKELASYGSLLHNELEMSRLESCGLWLAEKKDIPGLKGKKLLFRSHGEPPSSYELSRANNVEVIDATCATVKRLQNLVKLAAEEMEALDGQVVIYGKPDHPEVLGLLGQTDNRGIVVNNEDDLANIDFMRPVRLYSQTTMDKDNFEQLSLMLEQKLRAAGNDDFVSNNTICRHVINRIPSLTAFAEQNDVIIFVSGRESSNGNKLFKISKNINPYTHFVSNPDEVKGEWIKDAKHVGVSGAASTPVWLMEEVAKKIKEMS